MTATSKLRTCYTPPAAWTGQIKAKSAAQRTRRGSGSTRRGITVLNALLWASWAGGATAHGVTAVTRRHWAAAAAASYIK